MNYPKITAAVLTLASIVTMPLSANAESGASSQATVKSTVKTTSTIQTNSTDREATNQPIKKDKLIRTQKRTPAMLIEVPNGSLPTGANATLTKQNASANKSSAVSVSRHSVKRKRGMSHAAIRRGVLDAARNR
ncbi:MAG: hypothetical protein SGJ27_11475 [Candidatus Melainabacteria bacterium]|nr:hypothetical protein [Candidatus Melainabacteria bacterium]